jgi:hypothetical protein
VAADLPPVASVLRTAVDEWQVAVTEAVAGSTGRHRAGNRHAARRQGPDFDHRPVDSDLQPSPNVRRDPGGERFGLAPSRRCN